jgi:uncharacterized protein YbjT (DUF2867 family)
MTETVLVAGATGRLGREVIRELKKRGHRVRAMARTRSRVEAHCGEADEIVIADALRPATLPEAVQRVDRVFSCLGASVIPMPKYGGRTFSAVDFPANRNLIEAAKAAGVHKFLYVSVFGAHKLPQRDFIKGHELAVKALRESGMDYAVVRPTGFFQSMEEILLVASRGLLPEFGGGRARTNPIHEADLAEFCVNALFDPHPALEQDVGGPDVLSRREIAHLAAKAAGKEARIVKVPVGVLRSAGLLFRPFYPRVGHLMTFIADILVDDFAAPCYGRRRIADYFQERAAEMRGSS